ncbi:MAG: ABC transporter permease [Bacteroidales bacterium]|jgi:ABC-2 type transport system permease protein|nr:ABC transporter permease [Bacteroidales bacterium]
MNQFLSFVRKEFLHIFRDRRTLLIIIGIPVIQTLLIGFAISTELRNVEVAVFDRSKDAVTARIISRINAGEHFRVVQTLNSYSEVERAFQGGTANLVLAFGDHFSERLLHTGDAAVQLIIDASDPNQGLTIQSYISSIIGSVQQELLQEMNIPIRITPEIRMLYNPEMRSAYTFVPGLMGMIFMLICAMMTSIAIVREKETGTMEVLLASPMKPLNIVLSKMLPYFILSWFIFVIILLLSVFVLGVPVTGSLLWLNIFTVLFIIVALSLGLFISTVVQTQVAAILASGIGLIMPVMIFSGYVFPIESMPPILQRLSSIIPARWYITGAKKLMIEGVSVKYVIKEMLVLSGMAAAIIFISLKNIKTRLE